MQPYNSRSREHNTIYANMDTKRRMCRHLHCTNKTKMHLITAELGRALTVVKVTLQVNGNSQFLGVRPQKKLLGR